MDTNNKLKFDYGGHHKNNQTTGIIKAGTGVVKVHSIIDDMPDFMFQADIMFSDPPCSQGNISSFYTKANMPKENYENFVSKFFEYVYKLNPKYCFIEVFKSNYDIFEDNLKQIYKNVFHYENKYYNKHNCWILQGSNTNEIFPFLNNIDEQRAIELICEKIDFKCISDPCMGQGLVGYYTNKYNKKFVGTELNYKRLAVLLERIKKGKLNV